MLKPVIAVWRDMLTPTRAFRSEALERQFLRDYARRFAPERRAMALLAALVWGIYSYWDLVNLREVAATPLTNDMDVVLLLRVFGFVLLLVVTAVAAGPWITHDERRASALFMFSSLSTYLIAYWQMRLVPPDYAHAYYGLALTIIMTAAFTMFRLRGFAILCVMVVCVLAPGILLQIEVMWRPEVDLRAEQNYIFKVSNTLVALALLGAGLGQQIERTQRATFKREHELALSNQAFQRQSRELEALNEAIRQSSRQTEEKALALVDLKEQLRENAERKNQEKSQFLASAVHDLRQPLQAIGNALDPALRTLADGDVATARSMLTLAQTAAHLMAGQLAAMLEISRLESGLVQPETTSFDLRALAEGTLAQFDDMAAREGVRLGLLAPPDAEVWVESDRHFLGRILQNLVGNSIKYNDPAKGGERQVRLQLSNQPSCVRLEVEDNGVGIAQENIDSGAIFKPFYQVNNRRREAEKGVGLGLAIVEALLSLLREHRVDVHSTLGAGTRIGLEIPHGARNARQWGAARSAASDPATARLSGLYVLLVEDDELVNEATCALLKAHGALYEAVDSFDALDRLLATLERMPDMVLTDFRLPDGRTAVDVMQAIANHGLALPVVVFTGEALQAGAFGRAEPATVLYKPVPAADLVRAIDQAVKQAVPKVARP